MHVSVVFMPPIVPYLYQRVRSMLYVGFAHTALPTNTNFKITFLLTRLLEALYEDLPV